MKLSEIFVKYGGETIYRPDMDDKNTFEYRGYKARLEQDDDERFSIEYEPQLPRDVERMHQTCKSRHDFKRIATKAIDLAHAAQVNSSGRAFGSSNTGAGPGSGPLRRANG